MDKKLLFHACVLIFFIWFINTLANHFYWYSAMWWFDIPMHIVGGVFLALGAGAVFFKQLVSLTRREQFISIMLFVLIVGIGWEIFEYIVQTVIKGAILANIPDSIKDMVMDLSGGAFAAFFVLRRLRRYNRAHAQER